MLLLPVVPTTPDDHGQDEKDDEVRPGANRATNPPIVEGIAKDYGTENLAAPVEGVVQGAGAHVEVESIHAGPLVGVEDVGGEEHGEEQDDPRLAGDGLHKPQQLRLPCWVLHEDHLAAVTTQDHVGIAEEEGQNQTQEHEDDEPGIGTVGDRAGLLVDVLTERNERSDDGAEVEYDPEPRDVAALALLAGIAHHDGALGGPEQAGTDAEESTGEDDEALVLVVVVRQKAGGIDAVAQPAEREGELDTEHVRDGAREESSDGKGAVEGGVGVIVDRGINLTTTAETSDGVEHARAQEAHHGDQDQLEDGRRIPDLRLANLEALVHPSRRPLDGAVGVENWRGGGGGGSGLHLGFSLLVRHLEITKT